MLRNEKEKLFDLIEERGWIVVKCKRRLNVYRLQLGTKN
jgi:hypothetical protein